VVRKNEGKEQCGKPRRRREDNIKLICRFLQFLGTEIYRLSVVKATDIYRLSVVKATDIYSFL